MNIIYLSNCNVGEGPSQRTKNLFLGIIHDVFRQQITKAIKQNSARLHPHTAPFKLARMQAVLDFCCCHQDSKVY
jgi:hypothetical protein